MADGDDYAFVDVPGYEGFYQVNRMGQVLSLKSGRWCRTDKCKTPPKPRILVCALNSDKYANCILLKDGNARSMKVHRIVMLTFVGPSTLEVNHKNGIRHDNRLVNLEYVTHKENTHHSYAELGRQQHNAIPVVRILHGVETSFVSINAGARASGIDEMQIAKALKKGTHTKDGSYWRRQWTDS